MKAAKLIEMRQPTWRRLDCLCDQFGKRSKNKVPTDEASEFAGLYRQVCADLALAESNQLPPVTIDYLHQLVARAHNQLYRSKKFDGAVWFDRIFVETPKKIFNDPYVHIATVIFWGLFLASVWLAYDDRVWPGFAEEVAGLETLEQYEDMYTDFGGMGEPGTGRTVGDNAFMTGFYVYNNAGIGLKCFVTMLFVPLGMVTLTFNAMYLGTVFGFMYRPETGAAGEHFKNFVTAHGPFELTAIVLSAGAGLRIGLSWMAPAGISRSDALIKNGREALPVAMTGVTLFCMAALIEGFVSPTSEDFLPWWLKGVIATGSSIGLMAYLIVLGYPRPEDEIEEQDAA